MYSPSSLEIFLVVLARTVTEKEPLVMVFEEPKVKAALIREWDERMKNKPHKESPGFRATRDTFC